MRVCQRVGILDHAYWGDLIYCRSHSVCIGILVRIQLEYIEAQSIECRHAESADIMDSWDWRTLGSWIWRTLLSPHRLAVRSTEHPPMVTERLTDADGRGRRKEEGGKRKRDAFFSFLFVLLIFLTFSLRNSLRQCAEHLLVGQRGFMKSSCPSWEVYDISLFFCTSPISSLVRFRFARVCGKVEGP